MRQLGLLSGFVFGAGGMLRTVLGGRIEAENSSEERYLPIAQFGVAIAVVEDVRIALAAIEIADVEEFPVPDERLLIRQVIDEIYALSAKEERNRNSEAPGLGR